MGTFQEETFELQSLSESDEALLPLPSPLGRREFSEAAVSESTSEILSSGKFTVNDLWCVWSFWSLLSIGL